jgi:hypothetical protein
MGLFCFIREIINIFAVFPLRHPLIVMASFILLANATGIANKERAHLLLFAEVDHFARRFMAQVTDAPRDLATHPVFGPLQFLPPARVFLAAGLLSGKAPMPHVTLPLETANATS